MEKNILKWKELLQKTKKIDDDSASRWREERKINLERLNKLVDEINLKIAKVNTLLSQYSLEMSNASLYVEIEIHWQLKFGKNVIQFSSFNGGQYTYRWVDKTDDVGKEYDGTLNAYSYDETLSKNGEGNGENSFEEIMDIFFEEFKSEIVKNKEK